MIEFWLGMLSSRMYSRPGEMPRRGEGEPLRIILHPDRFAMPSRNKWGTVCVAFLVLFAAAAWGQDTGGADPYTVADVHVDVTAADGLAARDKARVEGQQR